MQPRSTRLKPYLGFNTLFRSKRRLNINA